MSEKSEQELIGEIKEGKANALASFLELRRRDLLAVILSKMGPGLRSKVEAEDIYQEVCHTALDSFRDVKFTDRGPFGWLCEVVDRRIIDTQRKLSAQKRDSAKEVAIDSGANSQVGLVNLLVASITSPSRVFSRKQKEFQLVSALDRLSAEQKTVLEMRYGQGKSSKDIAEKIGKSDGATRVLISRSLSRLRTLVSESEESESSDDESA